MTPEEQYEQRIRETLTVKGILFSKYEVNICDFDATALRVCCTEKQFHAICAEYGCSGIYADKASAAIITNFGVYNERVRI